MNGVRGSESNRKIYERLACGGIAAEGRSSMGLALWEENATVAIESSYRQF